MGFGMNNLQLNGIKKYRKEEQFIKLNQLMMSESNH